MCGHDWCSVRISKNIAEFLSGKAGEYAWDAARVSPALSAEQQEILARRGVLAPEEIARLAHKTRRAMGAAPGARAECHSEVAGAEQARRLQVQRLDPLTLEALDEPRA
jgi:phosphomethylpyrimidine synthase